MIAGKRMGRIRTTAATIAQSNPAYSNADRIVTAMLEICNER
jgi:hypothetical protein